MISRRRFMIGASVAAAGAVGGVIFTGRPFEAPTAAAAPDERFKYRGRNVVITPKGATPHIVVNGTHGIHVEREGNLFFTHLLPFSSFRTARELVMAVIDAEDGNLLII
jgi:hypothetical protein